MPNWCYGEVRIKGRKDNKKKFVDMLLSQTKDNSSKERYFARSWNNGFPTDEETELNKNVSSISLEVAWSIWSCWFSGYPQENSCCPTILEVSKELELELQVVSEEQGCCFREFYYIKNGELLENGTEDFPDEDFKEEDYPSEDEFQEAVDNWYFSVYDKFTGEFALTAE